MRNTLPDFQHFPGSALRKRFEQCAADRLQSGRRVIDLAMINPDLPPPQLLLDRLTEAVLKSHHHRYCVSRGIRKLREAFAIKYAQRFGMELDPENEVCACAGAKDGLFSVLAVLRDCSGVALLPNPGYPAFEFAAELSGFQVQRYDARRFLKGDFSEVEALVDNHPACTLIVNSPSNPLSLMLSEESTVQLKAILRKKSVFCINDFTYGELIFEGDGAPSLLGGGLSNVVELFSLSKAYSVPGWRIASVAGDTELISKVARYKSFRDYGLFLPVQIAASAALVEGDLASGIRNEYAMRAQQLYSALTNLGWTGAAPLSGCCLWLKVPDAIDDAEAFCLQLLSEYGVYLSCGSLYGEPWTRWVRIALVQSSETLHEVAARIFEMQRTFTLKNSDSLSLGV